jgi:hypothetical protein
VDAITTSGGGLVMDWTANQLQANDSSLSSGTTYYYAVIVRDVAQNKAIYAPVGQATLTPPTVGTGLTWTQKCGGSIAATWGVATDADTAQANLTYKVVYSTSNNISTVANAEANGIVAMNWTANTTNKLISGLTAGNTYYVNVLVRNNNSVMAAYGSASTTAATKALYLIQTTNNGQGYTWRIALDGSKVDYQNLTGRSINLDSSCNLYAGDTGGVVRKYDAFGNNLWTNNTGLGGGTVSSLALDEVNGILYAFGGLGIYTLNMSNGTVNSSFTYPTGNLGGNTSHGGNYFPDTDVLIQGDGNTGGSSTSRVWKMTGTGASNTAVTAPNDSFYGISGAQRDATGGYLLSDYSGSRALRFTLSGSTLTPDTSFGTSGKIDFTTQASSLAIDDSGNIYVSLRGLGVKKYSSAGALLDTSFYLYDGGTGPSSWQIVYK